MSTERMTLTLTNRDELIAWCGGHTPDDKGSDVALLNVGDELLCIPLGCTLVRTNAGWHVESSNGTILSGALVE